MEGGRPLKSLVQNGRIYTLYLGLFLLNKQLLGPDGSPSWYGSEVIIWACQVIRLILAVAKKWSSLCWSCYTFFSWSGSTAFMGEFIAGSTMQKDSVAIWSSLRHFCPIPLKFYSIRWARHGSKSSPKFTMQMWPDFPRQFSQFWAVYKS